MITRDEIVNKSEELSVHPSNVQRDYLFGWILAALYGHSDLAGRLLLKGGNCFRKAYFERARFSPDLDFAATGPIPQDYLTAQLNGICHYIKAHTGVQFDTGRTRVDCKPGVDRQTSIYKARLYFRDFFDRESELTLAVRLDISQFDRIVLRPQSRKLIHQYTDRPEADAPIMCLKLEESLASKLKCLLQRRHAADLYDFVNATLVNPAIDIDRKELVAVFLKKTIFASGPGIVKDLLINLPFEVIHGLWDKYLICPADARIQFDEAVEWFRAVVEELFGSLPRHGATNAFFPAHVRNPVMQAGHDLTVLHVVYDGIKREAEPYSLAYKVRKDGVAGEYLYVYDRTGGRSSGPGLKSWVHPNISTIENTDLKFEPRYEVELSKAGEVFGDRHFHGSPGPRFRPITFASIHIFECCVCGKQFRRKTYDVKLKAHKDKYGSPCNGRIGYLR